jgi:hypothetical protein
MEVRPKGNTEQETGNTEQGIEEFVIRFVFRVSCSVFPSAQSFFPAPTAGKRCSNVLAVSRADSTRGS